MLRWLDALPSQSQWSKRHAKVRISPLHPKHGQGMALTSIRAAEGNEPHSTRHATCVRKLDTLPRCVVGGKPDSPSPNPKLPSSNTKEPTISKLKPNRPFQEIAGDFCSYAVKDYLALVDCYSNWPNIILMGHNTTAPHLIKVVRQSFCHTGVPNIFWSDKGTQFTSKKFHDFAKQWGFTHIKSIPRYPQSNDKIEATVNSMGCVGSSTQREGSLRILFGFTKDIQHLCQYPPQKFVERCRKLTHIVFLLYDVIILIC